MMILYIVRVSEVINKHFGHELFAFFDILNRARSLDIKNNQIYYMNSGWNCYLGSIG